MESTAPCSPPENSQLSRRLFRLNWTTACQIRPGSEWSSAAARQGLWHKLGEITALLVAALCDIAISVVLHSTAAPILGAVPERHYLTLIVAIWYSFTELGSIVENAGLLGAPIPQWLKKGIALLRDKADGGSGFPKE